MTRTMPQTSGNWQVEWLTPRPAVEWLAVTIEVAEPSPEARICYTATQPWRG
jgi:hypothetical protein